MFDIKTFRLARAPQIVAVLIAAGLTATDFVEATPAAGERSSFAEHCGDEGRQSASVRSRNGRHDVKIRRGRCRLDVEMRGDVDFLDDESGVASMSRRARLEITEEIGRDERRLVVTPDDDGRPVYEWSIDDRTAGFDDDGRTWLRRILPEVFRATGIDAEARVGRILKRDGVDGVLHEVPLVHGDHTQRIYLEELVRQAEPDAGQLEETFHVAGREIGSDFELAELLIEVAATFAGDEALPGSYAEAIGTIASDFEHRRVVEAALSRRAPDPRWVDDLLSTATDIGSDFEVAELLIKAVRVLPEDEPLPETFFRAAGTIGSDFEQRRVLGAALARRELTLKGAQALLEASTAIGSDFEMAEFLIELGRKYPAGEAMPAVFEQALESVGSNFERQRVLAAVGDHRAGG